MKTEGRWEARVSFSSPWPVRCDQNTTLQRLGPVAHDTRLDRLDPIIASNASSPKPTQPEPIYRRGNPRQGKKAAIEEGAKTPGSRLEIGSSRVWVHAALFPLHGDGHTPTGSRRRRRRIEVGGFGGGETGGGGEEAADVLASAAWAACPGWILSSRSSI